MNFFNRIGYTDVHPYEVVRKVSEKCYEIRKMDAELDTEKFTPIFHPGGFAAHCSNQHEQKWKYSSNEEYPIIRVRNSVNHGWRDSHGNKYRQGYHPVKFHDYNF